MFASLPCQNDAMKCIINQIAEYTMSSEFLKFSCVNTDISQYLQKQRICGRFPEKLLRIDRFIQSGLHKRFRTTSPLTEQSSSFVWISSILSCVCTHLENQSFARFCRTSKMIRDTTHFEWASRKHAARQRFVDKLAICEGFWITVHIFETVLCQCCSYHFQSLGTISKMQG